MSLITHDVNPVQTPVGGYLCQRLLEGQPTAFVFDDQLRSAYFSPKIGTMGGEQFLMKDAV